MDNKSDINHKNEMSCKSLLITNLYEELTIYYYYYYYYCFIQDCRKECVAFDRVVICYLSIFIIYIYNSYLSNFIYYIDLSPRLSS